MRLIALCALLLACLISSPAAAKRWDYAPPQQPWWGGNFVEQRPVVQRRHHARRHHARRHRQREVRRSHEQRPAGRGLVTVSTAAGISVTVSPSFAPKITAFISDLVASGYKPRQIHCAASGGHVRGSRHYSGNACDFDQRGYGKTASPMYHVAALARQHGLRDGGSFRDWGHIDDGEHLARRTRVARIDHRLQPPQRRYVEALPPQARYRPE